MGNAYYGARQCYRMRVRHGGVCHEALEVYLLQQPAAAQQKHQYFKLTGRLEIQYFCPWGEHTHTHTPAHSTAKIQIFLSRCSVQHPWQRHQKAETVRHVFTGKIQALIFHLQQNHYSSSECKILNYYFQLHPVFMSVCVPERTSESACVCEHN